MSACMARIPTLSSSYAQGALLLGFGGYSYQIMAAPLALAWTCQMLSPLTISLFFICDLCIFARILIASLLRIKDEFGYLRVDARLTMHHFLVQKRGWIELAFVFPWDMIPLVLAFSSSVSCIPYGLNREISYYRLWALIRALKIIPSIVFLASSLQEVRVPKVSVQVGRFIKAILGLLIIIHISACLFFSLSFSQNTKKSWVWKKHLIQDEVGDPLPFVDQYIISINCAKDVFVFVTRKCVTDLEWIYSIFELIIATVIYGAFFGMINSILKSTMDSESIHRKKHYEHRYRQIKSHMHEHVFPKSLQDEILRHEQIKFLHLNGIDEKQVWKELPKDLHQEIVNFLYLDIIKSVPIFEKTSAAFRSAIALVLEPIHVGADTWIFKAGDEAKDMYFVLDGCVEITVPVIMGGDTTVRKIKRGDYFGDVALLRNENRSVSARTLINTDLGRLSRNQLNTLLLRFPEANTAMMTHMEQKWRQSVAASVDASFMDPPSIHTQKNSLAQWLMRFKR